VNERSNPAGPPTWGPQQPWSSSAKPGGPPQWAIIAVALVAVLGVIIGATVYFTRDASSGDSVAPEPAAAAAGSASSSPTPNPSDFASAADTGPVGIVTDEPTCAAWTPVNAALTAAGQNAAAMRTAADQTIALAKQTPHRVVRELYEQTAAYLTAYADGVAANVPANDNLAQVATSTALALTSMCEAIGNGSAATRAGLVPPAAAPTASTPGAVPPVRFLQPPTDPVCGQWHSLVEKYTAGFASWRGTNQTVAAAQWGPAQQRINDAVAPVMVAFADEVEALGQGTSNGVFQDFATFAGEYRRAFAAALPTYVPTDGALTRAASAATGAVDSACSATEG